MKAIVLDGYGSTDKLQLRDWPEPEPSSGQIKVKVVSAGINPIDWKLRSGAAKALMPLEFPALLGRDAAGEVVKVGSGVTDFKVGDRVLGLVMGAYAEYVVAAGEAWAKLPATLEARDAGALPLVLLTGDQLVDASLGKEGGSGLTLLVTGAVGAVGRVAVWVAKSRGAKVIAGVRGKQLEEASKLGADSVVALDDPAAVDALPPLDRIADTVGGETTKRLLSRLKSGGQIGSVVGAPAEAQAKGIQVNAFMARPNSARLGQLAAEVAGGKLVIPISKRFPLASAKAAQELAEAGGIGKVLLEP